MACLGEAENWLIFLSDGQFNDICGKYCMYNINK